MKKIILISLLSVLLIGCGGETTSINSPSSSSSEETSSSENVEITSSLKDVMTHYKQLGNYTYTINDEIFDITTTLRYTPTAYYYEPSKEEHGGVAHGYAENETGVFKYSISKTGEVLFDNYLTDKDGNYVKNMWFTTILSFLDIELNNLPDEPVEGHKYLIEDPYNKLLISGLAGLGDTALQQYINVYIELTSNDSFRTIVHTYGLVGDYIGYAYGELSNVGTTEIKEIKEVLDNNGGPANLDAGLIEMLKQLKASKNYTLTLTGEVNYVDRFTVRNYYSQDNDDNSKSKGFAGSEYGVFSYTISDGQVTAGEVVSNGNNGTFDSIWNMTNFNSLANLNLANLNYTKNNDGSYTLNDYSIINNFSLFAHMGYAQESGDLLKAKVNDDGLSFTFSRGEVVVNGVVNNIGTTSISEIESYIANGNGPLIYEDLDDYGRNFLTSLKQARNYTLTIESTYPTRSFNLTKKYTSTSYYQDYEDDQDDYGYVEANEGIYKLVNENGNLVKKDKVKDEGSFLWASNLFKSFYDFNTSSISGKKLNSSTYSITDNTTKNLICQIAGFGIYDLMFYLDTITFTILDNATLSCVFNIKLKDSNGQITITLSNYQNTEINNII